MPTASSRSSSSTLRRVRGRNEVMVVMRKGWCWGGSRGPSGRMWWWGGRSAVVVGGLELAAPDGAVEEGIVIAEPQGRPLAFCVRQATAAERRSVTRERASCR